MDWKTQLVHAVLHASGQHMKRVQQQLGLSGLAHVLGKWQGLACGRQVAAWQANLALSVAGASQQGQHAVDLSTALQTTRRKGALGMLERALRRIQAHAVWVAVRTWRQNQELGVVHVVVAQHQAHAEARPIFVP